MKDCGQNLKNSTQRPSFPGVFLALSLWMAEVISSSVGGLQLQTYGSTGEVIISDATDG